MPSSSRPSSSAGNQPQLQAINTTEAFQAVMAYDAARRSSLQQQQDGSAAFVASPLSYSAAEGNGSTIYGGTGSFIASTSPTPLSPTASDTRSPTSATAGAAPASSVSLLAKLGSSSKRRSSQVSIGDNLPHMPAPPPSTGGSRIGAPAPAPWVQPKWAPPASMSAATHSAKIGWADSHNDDDDAYAEEEEEKYTTLRPRLARESTPPALKGSNSVLVTRELERLRGKDAQKLKLKWRTVAGVSTLFILALSVYVLVRYILAFLELSPSTFLLSAAADGTQSSPDPLLRIMALIGVVVSGLSVAGVLGSGFYLRFSRRRSCGTWFIWLVSILSTTLSLLLCVLNFALIVIWHKKYSRGASVGDALAATRDVGQRCNGVWEMDLLWSAAASSPLAKPDEDTTNCAKNAEQTFKMFLIAAGVRLILFVLFSTAWIACLQKYNRVLGVTAMGDPFAAHESAEMHRLLEEEERLRMAAMPGAWEAGLAKANGANPYGEEMLEYEGETLRGAPMQPYQGATLQRGVYDDADLDTVYAEKEEAYDEWTTTHNVASSSNSHLPTHYQPQHLQYAQPQYQQQYQQQQQTQWRDSTSTLAAPTLQRFAWQKADAEQRNVPYADRALPDDNDEGLHSSSAHGHGHHKESSAGGWGAGLVGRAWDAICAAHDAVAVPTQEPTSDVVAASAAKPRVVVRAATEEEVKPAAATTMEDAAAAAHGRGKSRLGISGWFRRDASGSVEETSSAGHGDVATTSRSIAAATAGGGGGSNSRARHARTASQEQRASQARHMASPPSSKNAAKAGAARSASSPSRPASATSGDDYAPMPEPYNAPAPAPAPGSARTSEEHSETEWHMRGAGSYGYASGSGSEYGGGGGGGTSGAGHGGYSDDEDDDAFWYGGSNSRPAPPPKDTPVFVRTLGRLVRKLSMIASEGSEERYQREPSASGAHSRRASASTAAGGHAGTRRSISRHSRTTRSEDITEVEEPAQEGVPSSQRHARDGSNPFPGAWARN